MTSDPTPKYRIIPHSIEFTLNGVVKGTLMCEDVDGNYICEVYSSNWSRQNERMKAAEEFARWSNLDADACLPAIMRGLGEARSAEKAERQAEADAPPPPPPPAHDRPVIPVNGNITVGKQARATVSAILAHNRSDNGPHIFRFGSASMADIIPTAGRDNMEIRQLGKNELLVLLDGVAEWIRTDGHTGVESPANPPPKVIDYLLGSTAVELPQLRGIASSPYCMPNGSIIRERGYSDSSGLYLASDVVDMPDVPESPSVDQVSDAVYQLTGELFVDFPFAGAADAANSVAVMLNSVCRPMIAGPTPLFVIEAPTPRTGKSLLAETLGRVTTGRAPKTLPHPANREEFEKTVVSTLMEGASVALMDNVNTKLDSATLASVLTSIEPAVRVMRTQKVPTFPNRVTWVCTANNMQMSEELAGRSVYIKLDAGMEDPSSRTGFHHADIRGWVTKNRGMLLNSCFVLVRNWIAKGRPLCDIPFGSFEAWTQLVGGILKAADIPGFLENRSEGRERTDDSAQEDRGFVLLWSEQLEWQAVDSEQLLEMAKQHKVLLDIYAGRSHADAVNKMGVWLRQRVGRAFGGWKVTRYKQNRLGRRLWILEKTERLQPSRTMKPG